ncbi:MAG: hypothetical protein ACTHU0_37385 [Kofleriaceae bacterium]
MTVPPAVLLARFRRFYPPEIYRAPHYPTRDHVIPLPLFAIYSAAMPHLMAMERLSETRALVHAIGLAFADPKKGPLATTRAEFREAFLPLDE